ncbi:uncharacterized protein IL334_000767 [Kwoniella shivajii]|uniref:Uncharacterized protein n=1 Tax=Kwoniella shivajii TaxID=564305 RepID=A0ABZ1CR39_9TREE|nr:hypothetical protein IL334_000767 [Kwoniella shivajii]
MKSLHPLPLLIFLSETMVSGAVIDPRVFARETPPSSLITTATHTIPCDTSSSLMTSWYPTTTDQSACDSLIHTSSTYLTCQSYVITTDTQHASSITTGPSSGCLSEKTVTEAAKTDATSTERSACKSSDISTISNVITGNSASGFTASDGSVATTDPSTWITTTTLISIVPIMATSTFSTSSTSEYASWQTAPSFTSTSSREPSTLPTAPSSTSSTSSAESTTTKPPSSTPTSTSPSTSQASSSTAQSPPPPNRFFGELTYELGQYVIMYDETANNMEYKSQAKNNKEPWKHTMSLLTDNPNTSKRRFEIWIPSISGAWGHGVEGSKRTRIISCEITFEPGNEKNKAAFAVWNGEPHYYNDDPENKVHGDCKFLDP